MNLKEENIDINKRDIAYFASVKSAIEILKDRDLTDEKLEEGIKDWRDKLYKQWLEWRLERMDENSKYCSQCKAKMKLVPAGVSKKSGAKYDAFWVCDSCDYKESTKKVDKGLQKRMELPAEERPVQAGETPYW